MQRFFDFFQQAGHPQIGLLFAKYRLVDLLLSRTFSEVDYTWTFRRGATHSHLTPEPRTDFSWLWATSPLGLATVGIAFRTSLNLCQENFV